MPYVAAHRFNVLAPSAAPSPSETILTEAIMSETNERDAATAEEILARRDATGPRYDQVARDPKSGEWTARSDHTTVDRVLA